MLVRLSAEKKVYSHERTFCLLLFVLAAKQFVPFSCLGACVLSVTCVRVRFFVYMSKHRFLRGCLKPIFAILLCACMHQLHVGVACCRAAAHIACMRQQQEAPCRIRLIMHSFSGVPTAGSLWPLCLIVSRSETVLRVTLI